MPIRPRQTRKSPGGLEPRLETMSTYNLPGKHQVRDAPNGVDADVPRRRASPVSRHGP